MLNLIVYVHTKSYFLASTLVTSVFPLADAPTKTIIRPLPTFILLYTYFILKKLFFETYFIIIIHFNVKDKNKYFISAKFYRYITFCTCVALFLLY